MGLVWLASYPKSGNTWLRAAIHSAVSGDEPDINALGPGGHIDGIRTADGQWPVTLDK